MNTQEYKALPNIIKDNTNLINSVINNDRYTYYQYKDIKVPRVSKILDAGIGNRGLVDWAARVGYTKMNMIRDTALTVGTIVHELIEHNIKYDKDLDFDFASTDLDSKGIQQVCCAYENFKQWKSQVLMHGNEISVIGTEVPVSCPWYGGTIDCIMKINGDTYIVDYKTSKQISTNYLLQTCSYAWMINNGYCDICDHVDGIGILRVDKSYRDCFDEYFLNYKNPQHHHELLQYTQTFWAIVNSFYNLAYTNQLYYDSDETQYIVSTLTR